jgi:CrcB protein
MHTLLLIGAGGCIGAILRYEVSGWLQSGATTFPLGTLGVNVIGCFLLSLVMNLSEYRGILGEEARVFLTIGLLGAFTTMSTFDYESFRLLEARETLLCAVNILGTVALALLAVYAGRAVVLALGRW